MARRRRIVVGAARHRVRHVRRDRAARIPPVVRAGARSTRRGRPDPGPGRAVRPVPGAPLRPPGLRMAHRASRHGVRRFRGAPLRDPRPGGAGPGRPVADGAGIASEPVRGVRRVAADRSRLSAHRLARRLPIRIPLVAAHLVPARAVRPPPRRRHQGAVGAGPHAAPAAVGVGVRLALLGEVQRASVVPIAARAPSCNARSCLA